MSSNTHQNNDLFGQGIFSDMAMKFGTQFLSIDNSQDSEQRQFERIQKNVSNFLNDLVKEQEQYNYQKPSVARMVAQSIGNEINTFSKQLLEQKMNQPRGLHDIPAGTIGLQLNEHHHTQAIQDHLTLKGKKQDQKDRNDLREQILLNEKLEWIRLKKKIEYVTDLDPFQINIETIFNLPSNIKVKDDEASEIRQPQSNEELCTQKFNDFKKQISEEIHQDNSKSQRRKDQAQLLIDSLFQDKMEQSHQVLTKDQINPITTNVLVQPQASISGFNIQPSVQVTDPSHQSINTLDQAEIVDINFYRDLAPSARMLAKPLQKDLNNRLYNKEEKKRREEQKRILTDLIEIEPSQQNLDDDMYLLAISGQAPFDKCNIQIFYMIANIVVERMNALSKWVVKDSYILDEIYKSDSSQDDSDISSSLNGELDQSPKTIQMDQQSKQLNEKRKSLNKKQDKKASANDLKVESSSMTNSVQQYYSQQPTDENNDTSLFTKTDKNNTYKSKPHKQSQQHHQAKNRMPDRADSYNSNITNDNDNQLHIQLIVDQLLNENKHKRKQTEQLPQERQRNQSDMMSMQYKSNKQTHRQYTATAEMGNNSSISSDDDQINIKEKQQQAYKTQQSNMNKNTVRERTRTKSKDLKSQQQHQQQQQLLNYQESLGLIIDECEFTVSEKLQSIEELIGAKNEINSNMQQIKNMSKKQKLTQAQHQSLKNNERMKQEITKRIEKHLISIVQTIDDKTQEARQAIQSSVFNDETIQILSTQTVLKASSLADQDDIDEQIKAKFIARLVREFCNNREREKQIKLKEQVEKEIEQNIYQRFPGLTKGGSPPSNKGSVERNNRRQYDSSTLAQSRVMISPDRYNKSRNIQNNSTALSYRQPNTTQGNNATNRQQQYYTKQNELFEIQENELSTGLRGGGKDFYESQKNSQTNINLRPPPLNKINHFKSANKPKNMTNTTTKKSKVQQNKEHLELVDKMNPPRKAPYQNYAYNYQSQRNQPTQQSSIGKIQQSNKKKTAKIRNQDDMPPQDQWIGGDNDQFFD